MPTFERHIDIRAGQQELFDLTQDYPHRLDWDPYLKEARLIDASEAAVGVRAWCVSTEGWGMETEYVTFVRPEVIAMKMTKGPWFLERFAGSWRFDVMAPGTTRVTFRYNVELRTRALRLFGNYPVTWVFARDMNARLRALKAAFEA